MLILDFLFNEIADFSSKATPPEVTCYCPFGENHIHFPTLQEDHTDMVVWGGATALHKAGPIARLLAKGGFQIITAFEQPLATMLGKSDRFEATKDRTW